MCAEYRKIMMEARRMKRGCCRETQTVIKINEREKFVVASLSDNC